MEKSLLNETQLIENVINKLQAYMKKHNMNLHSLATTIGFQYQPFYRLIKNKRLPAISSLIIIANYLNYSLGDLLSDKIYMDVKMMESINELGQENNYKSGKIIIPYNLISSYITSSFIGLKIFTTTNFNIAKIYVAIDHFNLDGEFIVNHINKNAVFNVTSISSTFINIDNHGEEKKVGIEEVKPIARFIGEAILMNNDADYVFGTL